MGNIESVVKVEPLIVSDSIGFVKGASTRHRGIALLPQLMVRQELERRLTGQPVPDGDFGKRRSVASLYPQRKAYHASQVID
ncbi:hypothetical protein O9929_27430 [Vibrio lentus]|nr:hypothetical protein [Vibrio lentus]